MTEPSLWLVCAVFLLAGSVKGVVGLGLPAVSIALLTFALGPDRAVVLMLLPALVTNLYQALVGGHLLWLLRELRGFFIGAALCVWLGVMWRGTFDLDTLTSLVGAVVMAYAAVGLAVPVWPKPSAQQTRWLHPAFGVASGTLTGLSGLAVLPGALYLQALQLGRDRQVQALGVLFSVTTLGLLVALGSRGTVTPQLLTLSAIGVVPALLGLWLGGRFRKRLSERQFRQVVLVALLLLGAYLVIRTGLVMHSTEIQTREIERVVTIRSV